MSTKILAVTARDALPGRPNAMPVLAPHRVLGRPMLPPWPAGCREVLLGMGCFWGAERRLWGLPGVHVTAVGYAGGFTPNPTYHEVCSGRTGHAEVVRVMYHPEVLPLESILRVFWEAHDPTQGMRQGNDIGTQYRSAIYTNEPDDLERALASRSAYEAALQRAGRGPVTTEIAAGVAFYFAEPDHQQYLDANPHGYCGLRGTGVEYPC
jgi:peptide-methionine (S)-S-oxide reductase